MAFTWTGDPGASEIEAVRWEINDIDSTKPKFQDAEIQYALDQEYSTFSASARCCEQLQAKYSDTATRTMGPLKVEMNKLASDYATKARNLRRRAVAFATPYVGGISKARETIYENDSDLIQPVFEEGMMDNKR